MLQFGGCSYQFVPTNEVPHVMSVTIDQRVHITLKGLPSHMWTNEIVELLFSPHCVVEYTGQRTHTMEDLSEYVCTTCSQRVLRMSNEIALMVPQNADFQPF